MNSIATTADECVNLRLTDTDEITPTTIIDIFKRTILNHGTRRALLNKVDNKWYHYTWDEYYDMCREFAKGFMIFGLNPHEGVAIIGSNSPEWFISNMAAIFAGGVSVGIYGTNSAELCEYIINDSNSTIIIVEDNIQLEKILSIRHKLSNIRAIIQYKGNLEEDKKDYEYVFSWNDFYVSIRGLSFHWEKMDDIMKNVQPGQCSTLIYTSGTTGNPKGVMLSHDNIIWTTQMLLSTIDIKPDNVEKIVSYLPLSHVAAQMLDIYMPLVNAGETWFADSDALKGSLVDTLKAAQPTIFLGVPRVWEKIREGMMATSKNNSSIKKKIGSSAKKIGLKKFNNSRKGDEKSPFGWAIYDKLVFKKVKSAIGLDNCKLYLTGAAPITKEVLEYFASLNILINDIYGMSECSGPMTVSHPGAFRFGSCGQAVPNTLLKVDEITKEICTYGRHIMMGYLNQSNKTRETIDKDGWLHSGDMGEIDEDGYLFITGRIKELIITAGGENIGPVAIEDAVKAELPIISNCVLIGDKQKYLTMLITLKCIMDDDGNMTDILDDSVIDLLDLNNNLVSKACNNKKLIMYIDDGIQKVNQKSASNAQKIQKFRILPTDFSINGGELGPTLKLKRMVVFDMYSSIIDDMYNDS